MMDTCNIADNPINMNRVIGKALIDGTERVVIGELGCGEGYFTIKTDVGCFCKIQEGSLCVDTGYTDEHGSPVFAGDYLIAIENGKEVAYCMWQEWTNHFVLRQVGEKASKTGLINDSESIKKVLSRCVLTGENEIINIILRRIRQNEEPMVTIYRNDVTTADGKHSLFKTYLLCRESLWNMLVDLNRTTDAHKRAEQASAIKDLSVALGIIGKKII